MPDYELRGDMNGVNDERMCPNRTDVCTDPPFCAAQRGGAAASSEAVRFCLFDEVDQRIATLMDKSTHPSLRTHADETLLELGQAVIDYDAGQADKQG